MDWKSASSYYENRLSEVLTLQRYAMDLAILPQAKVPANLQEILKEEEKPLRKQLERLKKREFRIAVVGLEKAGKSTFINAWLECDLLPAKGGRCTFTTTQIYSVPDESEQKLEVIVRNEGQFQSLLKELKKAGANEDLKTITTNESTLQQVRLEGNISIPFTRLEDIKEHLKKYVADEKYAHSVLEARLYTSKLAQAEGIVFYDVPGSDSGLTKHVDEAKTMLSDCDTVIVIQRFRSIREAELQIINFTESGDKNITVADKTFVFLSHIDTLGSAEALKTHIQEASQDWLKRGNLPPQRIAYGSAGAYLILNDLAGEHTQLEIDKLHIREKLSSLTGINDDNELKTTATGIPLIKEKIFHYINNERVLILQKRCDTSINNIVKTAKEIYYLVNQKFPENPEDAKRSEEERRRILFLEWWATQWEKIKAKLQNYYDTSVVYKHEVNSEAPSVTSIERFKQRYLNIVAEKMAEFREKISVERDIIFEANSFPELDRVKVNIIWRESLYSKTNQLLASLAEKLALELKDEALRLVEFMSDLLWGSHQVKERVLENSEDYFLAKLENSLSVLFLRFVRPITEVLIRGAVGSETRNKTIKTLGADIEIVDNYYSGDEEAFKVLKKYAKYGPNLLSNPKVRKEILGIEKVSEKIESPFNLNDESISARDAVIFEVESDINAFEEYLLFAIFEAAGFESYCIHELRRLVDSFREKEGTWTGVVLNEWLQENNLLMKEIPEELKSQEYSLEVSERLRQLSIALEKNLNNVISGL